MPAVTLDVPLAWLDAMVIMHGYTGFNPNTGAPETKAEFGKRIMVEILKREYRQAKEIENMGSAQTASDTLLIV